MAQLGGATPGGAPAQQGAAPAQQGAPADPMTRLTAVLERLVAAPRAAPHREEFKTPQYTGEGDVEYFIRQFDDVADANQWDAAATFMHLREALREGARDCGQSGTIHGIHAALRAQFGLFPGEAMTRLNNLRKEYRTTLAEHAAEVKRLTRIAYHDLPNAMQRVMMLEQLVNALDNTYLQRHLLAVDPRDLDEAVRAGSKWLNIRQTPRPTQADLCRPPG